MATKRKQETILSAFSRQKKPMVACAKAKSDSSEVDKASTRISFPSDPFRPRFTPARTQLDDGNETDGDALASSQESCWISQDQEDDVARVSCDFSKEELGLVDMEELSPLAERPSHNSNSNCRRAEDIESAALNACSLVPRTNSTLLQPNKVIKDSVHGCISFEPLCIRIIDTLQFQRLRNLHQNGAANFVYIGATHSRFEHCLGVAFLAEKLLRTIQHHQPWLDITWQDVLCVKIAGLCHDLGHGPFSHVFDGIFMHQLRHSGLQHDTKWTHEQGSLDLLEFLLRENAIRLEEYGLDGTRDLIFIKELIFGGPLDSSPDHFVGRSHKNKRFLYEIVNNAKTGLDVDKLDYFMRDAVHTGTKSSCDTDLIIGTARVLVDRDDPEQKLTICFPEKLVHQVMQVFRTRFELHQAVYQHKVVRAIDYMICDVLLAANAHLRIKNRRISDVIHHLDAYQHLDDRILGRIQESDDPALAPAQAILRRIYCKPLYECIGRTNVTAYSHAQSQEELLDQVLACGTQDKSLLHVRDQVILEVINSHFGKKDQDPLQFVRFFAKHATADAQCFQLPLEQYANLCPRVFSDRAIRIFVKEHTLAQPVREAFVRWSTRYNRSLVVPVAGTD